MSDETPESRNIGAQMGAEAPREIRSFGRRRARQLSPRQAQLLAGLDNLRVLEGEPSVAVQPTFARADRTLSPNLKQIIDGAGGPVWLEIGFGGGEHLIWQAASHRDTTMIVCDPFIDGVVKALTGIEEQCLTNVFLHDDDAREVLRVLPDGEIDRAFILFPDPWPKSRHIKRRIINPALLSMLARLMKPGAQLRIATDIADYSRTILLSMRENGQFDWPAQSSADWAHRRDDWPETRYEQKANREGRRSCFYTFVRRA